ncbi:ubiquitin carboxyl-terminal hydrolase 8-like [Plasmopara halstedii]|uniref:Ubiquitin carboxyl-terminal hydrolase n=1 Tax=Plasmopara halstedii TaxID=4781 RepID=A0A0P1AWP7_PLAHL|nr:ubiquitin carboxyl-terminal hydrolase 8-like [Plasmopara halstedii]CEG46804.1 ubiquitin carboxyl-terminal hydrolase 8-like [Plasmopara halstedii]|eukprot:XP_024583173.1 ubiquitin carboxyl-terminal hydrolase 8-like [Plasmopara halstedii]
MTDWRPAPARTSVFRFPWLLFFWWAPTKLWLRRLLKYWVQRPLMRLCLGSIHENDYDLTITDQHYSDATLPCGLVNTGNLCFVNAVLQCLAVVPGFLDGVNRALQMRTQLHHVQEMDDAQTQKLLVIQTLVSLLEGIQAEHDEDEVESAASRCTYLISSAASRQEQQDAEEFLTFLLELLHGLLRAPAQPVRSEVEERRQFLLSEQRILNRLRRYDPDDPRSYLNAVENLGDLRWNYYLRQSSSIVTDLFSGQTVRGSQCCSCAKLTCLHEEQRVISLSIQASKSGQTLANCIESFRHTEKLTDENCVFCDGYCQVKTARLTQTLFHRVPPVLILTLQRFRHTSLGGNIEKVNTKVSFPCESGDLLDLKQSCFRRDTEERTDFELIAVCAHLGGSNDSGHYVAYVRHRGTRGDCKQSDQWLRIDDDVVTVIDVVKFRAETETTAYLLFYSLVTSSIEM